MIFGRRKIGFIVDNPLPYNQAMASTRLRCYDVITQLKKRGTYKASLFNRDKAYSLVVFQKCFTPDHALMAAKLRKQNVKVVLDINVNYLDVENGISFVSEDQKSNLCRMLENCDAVLTASSWLEKKYRQEHDQVFCIEEIITDNFFRVRKKHINSESIKLLYCGYSAKAKELFLIKDVLKKLAKKIDLSIIFISEKDPGINLLPYQFIPYDHNRLPDLLLQGDIKIAPRNLNMAYNMGHTMTKIAYPMATGLPVVASPVPSYINRGVVLCENLKDWETNLEVLINSSELRDLVGGKGRDAIRCNFSSGIIGAQYEKVFDFLLRN